MPVYIGIVIDVCHPRQAVMSLTRDNEWNRSRDNETPSLHSYASFNSCYHPPLHLYPFKMTMENSLFTHSALLAYVDTMSGHQCWILICLFVFSATTVPQQKGAHHLHTRPARTIRKDLWKTTVHGWHGEVLSRVKTAAVWGTGESLVPEQTDQVAKTERTGWQSIDWYWWIYLSRQERRL